MGDKELVCVDKFGRPLAGEEPIVRSCTMPGHSRGAVHCKVDGGHTSRTRVVESTHPSVPPARSSNQLTRRGKTSVPCLHPPSETVNLPPTPILSCTLSVQEGDSRPSWETAMRSLRESPSLGRRTASPHAPHNPGTRGRESDGRADNGEHQDTAKLLHKTEAAPHLGDPDDGLNGAVSPEASLVAETAPLHRALPHRGSPQSTLESWDPIPLPQRLARPRR